MSDIEKRTDDFLRRIRAERERKKSEDYFRQKKEREAKDQAREKEEAEQLKATEKRWNPYLEKAMQRAEEEEKKRNERINMFKK